MDTVSERDQFLLVHVARYTDNTVARKSKKQREWREANGQGTSNSYMASYCRAWRARKKLERDQADQAEVMVGVESAPDTLRECLESGWSANSKKKWPEVDALDTRRLTLESSWPPESRCGKLP